MRKTIVLAFLALPVWANTCTLTQNTALSASAGKWTGAGCAGVPGNGDTVTVNNVTLTVDQPWTIGNGGNAHYGSLRGTNAVTVTNGGTGYTNGTQPATFAGGKQYNGTWPVGTCSVAGGVVQSITLTDVGSMLYAAPTVTCPGGSGIAATVDCNCGGIEAIKIIGANGKVRNNSTIYARGEIRPQTSTSANVAWDSGPGATLYFDFSQSPANTVYLYGPDATGITTPSLFADTGCTAAQPCTVSTVGTGIASFRVANTGYGPSVQTFHTNYSNLGGTLNPGNRVMASINVWPYAGYNVRYDIENATFTNCARVDLEGSGSVWSPDSVAKHIHNVHVNTNDVTPFMLGSNAAPTTGIYQVLNNVFDKGLNSQGVTLNLVGQQIEGNYFGSAIGTAGNTASLTWASFSKNFYHAIVENSGAVFRDQGDVSLTYFFYDVTGLTNPHWATGMKNYGSTASDVIFESPDPNTGDSGEAYNTELNATSANTLHTVRNSILLPSRDGNETGELGSVVSTAQPNTIQAWDHNTWIGTNGGGFGAVQIENGTAAAGALASMRSNAIYNGAGSAAGYKLAAQSNPSNPTQDVCTPANCDYNAGWNLRATMASCTGCVNQGRSYVDKWSVVPGAHDLDVVYGTAYTNPRFADPLRNVSLWYTKYLGLIPASQWQTATVYVPGNIVWDSNASVWSGQKIAYRCTAAHTSDAATRPNAGNNWRADWEPASLYAIQQAIIAGTMYTDGAIGCANCHPVEALVRWVKQGYVPQNPLYWGAGHDGQDIGAANLPMVRHLPPPVVLP
jgi:hypothetical protein